MNDLLNSLKPYLNEPHEYRLSKVVVQIPVKKYKKEFHRMEFIRLHPGKPRLTTFLRIDYSGNSPFDLHKVELRMSLTILGMTFTRKLAGLSNPNMLNGADPYIRRGETIFQERKQRINQMAYDEEYQINCEKMQKAVRNVQH